MILYATKHNSKIYHEVESTIDSLADYKGEISWLVTELLYSLRTTCGQWISGYSAETFDGWNFSVFSNLETYGTKGKHLCAKCRKAKEKEAK